MTELTHIEDWIPQRPPFVFIDVVDEVSETYARTRFVLKDSCPLVQDGKLRLAGMMENMAQTCAARAGWVQRQRGEEVKIGYIGAVKRMQATRLPRVGETLVTEATVVEEVMNICLIECVARIDNEVIGTSTLKLAITEE
jgi:predicted hotdog family 3-hydroxylacyl-ACP dehydratase